MELVITITVEGPIAFGAGRHSVTVPIAKMHEDCTDADAARCLFDAYAAGTMWSRLTKGTIVQIAIRNVGTADKAWSRIVVVATQGRAMVNTWGNVRTDSIMLYERELERLRDNGIPIEPSSAWFES